MPKLPAARPLPYADKNDPNLHRGIVQTSTSGVVTVDLGLNHNNFAVQLTLMGGVSADGVILAWAYGTKKGTFVITASKRPGAYGAWIADTVARDVSFVAYSGATVE